MQGGRSRREGWAVCTCKNLKERLQLVISRTRLGTCPTTPACPLPHPRGAGPELCAGRKLCHTLVYSGADCEHGWASLSASLWPEHLLTTWPGLGKPGMKALWPAHPMVSKPAGCPFG